MNFLCSSIRLVYCSPVFTSQNAIENNKYNPTLALAFDLARELKITVDELFMAAGH